jgi:hypothetical protein
LFKLLYIISIEEAFIMTAEFFTAEAGETIQPLGVDGILDPDLVVLETGSNQPVDQGSYLPTMTATRDRRGFLTTDMTEVVDTTPGS